MTKNVVLKAIPLVAKEALCDEDLDVQGVWHIELDDACPDDALANAALDYFHSCIAVDALDDFSFVVEACEGTPLVESDNYPSYSLSYGLDITKCANPTTFEDVAHARRWSLEEQYRVLLDYVANQQDNDALVQFALEQPAAEPRAPIREQGVVNVLLENGSVAELCLLLEEGTKNVFAIEASYVSQEAGDVFSPYGNGIQRFDDAVTKCAPMPPQFSHSVLEVHILSDDPDLDLGAYTLADIQAYITTGDGVGQVRPIRTVGLTEKQVRERLVDFGSDPSFFFTPDQ